MSNELELFNLAKLIEEKEIAIKKQENYKLQEQQNLTDLYKPEDIRPGIGSTSVDTPKYNSQEHQALITSLNSLLQEHTELSKETYSPTIPEITDVGYDISDHNAFKVDENGNTGLNPEFTLEDLINSNRPSFPANYTDAQILNFINVTNPNLVKSIRDKGEVTERPTGWLEGELGEGYASQVLDFYTMQFQKNWHYDMPAGRLALTPWKDLPPEEAYMQGLEILKEIPGFKDKSDDELKFEVDKFLEKGHKLENIFISKLLKEGQEFEKEWILNNPQAMASIELMSEKDLAQILKDGDIGKWLTNLGAGAIQSYGQIATAQMIGGVLADMATTTIGGLWLAGTSVTPDPGDILAATHMAQTTRRIGQFFAGSLYGLKLEHAGYMANAVVQLTTPHEISSKEFSDMIQAKQKFFLEKVREMKEGQDLGDFASDATIVDRMMKKYLEMHFMQTEDGRMFTRPTNIVDAIEAVKTSAAVYGSISGLIEQSNLFARWAKIPVAQRAIRNKFKDATLYKMLDTIRDTAFIRGIKDIGTFKVGESYLQRFGKKAWNFALLNNTNWLAESGEEIGQSLVDIAVTVHGPGWWAREGRGKWDPDATWKNKYSFRHSVFEPAVGGALGGKFGSLVNQNQNNKGITERLINLNVNKQLENLATDEIIVKKVGYNEYELINKTKHLDENGELVTEEKPFSNYSPNDILTVKKRIFRNDKIKVLKDPVTLEDLQTKYPDFDSASQVAESYNIHNKEIGEKRVAWANQWLVGVETELVSYDNEHGHPVWRVVVKNKKGDTVKVISDNHENKHDANVSKNKIDKNIIQVNNIVDKYGLEDINNAGEDIDSGLDNINQNNKNDIPVYQDGHNWVNQNKKILNKADAKTLIKGWMIGHVNEETGHKVDIKDNELEVHNKLEEDGFFTDPDIIAANLEMYPDILLEEQISIDAIMQNFEESFYGQDGVEEYLKVIEDALNNPYNEETNDPNNYIPPEQENIIGQESDEYLENLRNISTGEYTDEDDGGIPGIDFPIEDGPTDEKIIQPKLPFESDTEVETFEISKLRGRGGTVTRKEIEDELEYYKSGKFLEEYNAERKKQSESIGMPYKEMPVLPARYEARIEELENKLLEIDALDKFKKDTTTDAEEVKAPEKPETERPEVEIDEETYDEDITITEPKEILTIEQADEMLIELEEYKYTLRNKDDGSPEIQNELNDIERAIDEVSNKKLEISQKEFSEKREKEKIELEAVSEPITVDTLEDKPVSKEIIESKSGVKHIPNKDKKDLTELQKDVTELVNKEVEPTKDLEGEFGRRKFDGHKALWYGPTDYEYGGAYHSQRDMPPWIAELGRTIEKQFGLPDGYFDSVLINSYPPTSKGIPAHRDNEEIFRTPEGINAVGTLSLGGETVIDILNTQTNEKESHVMKDGDMYLLPDGDFQDINTHAVGPSKKDRISLTFRKTNIETSESLVDVFDNVDISKRLDPDITSNMTEEEYTKYLSDKTEQETKKKEVEEPTKPSTILTNRKDKLVPTKQQEGALVVIEEQLIPEMPSDGTKEQYEFVNNPTVENVEDNIIVFSGFAGTGKTTIVENIVRQSNDKGYDVMIAAYTNTAVRRLRDKNVSISDERLAGFGTLHKYLYGPQVKGKWVLKSETEFNKDTRFPSPSGGTILIVDEASMVDVQIKSDIEKLIKDYGLRVVYMGDGFQLKPVKDDPRILENLRPIEKKIVLTDVQRQKAGGILTLATAIRNHNYKSLLDKKGYTGALLPSENLDNVYLVNTSDFKNKFELLTKIDERDGTANTVIITYKNTTRQLWNAIARSARYGTKEINPVNKNERVISLSNNETYNNGDQFTLSNPEFVSGPHKIRIKDKSKWLGKGIGYGHVLTDGYIIRDDAGNEQLLIPDTLGNAALQHDDIMGAEDTEFMKRYMQKKKMYGREVDIFSEKLSILTYAYAVTGHKVQGMEYPNVFVISEDMNAMQYQGVPDLELKGRWFYTAITRAEQQLYIQDISGIKKFSGDELKEIAFDVLSERQMRIASEGEVKVQPKHVQNKVKKIARMLFDKFEGKIGLEFTDNISDDITIYKGQIAAYYDKKENKVVINTALANPDAPFHEFMHPFITEIRELNPEFYDNILKEIISTIDGRAIIEHVMESYVDKEKRPKIVDEFNYLLSKVDNINQLTVKELYDLFDKYDSKDKELSDELIAYSIAFEAEVMEDSMSSKFMKAVRKIFDWIRAKLFGPVWKTNIYARSLDPDMTFVEIARLLVNSDRKFTLERVDVNIAKEQYSFTPKNRYQFMAFVEKEQEISISDELSRDKAWLKDFFNRMWSISKPLKGKTKKEDFFHIMDSVLMPEIKENFYTWYRGKFNIKKPKGDNSQFQGENSIYDSIEEEVLLNDENLFDIARRMGQTNSNEKVLASHGMTFLKDFGATILQSDLNRMIVLSKRGAFNTFEKWMPEALRILRYRGKLPQWKQDGLLKFYNRIRSMERTNNGKLSGIINYELKITEKENGQNSFEIVVKEPERKFIATRNGTPIDRSRSNPGFQKKTLADYMPDIKGLFEWVSGKDIRVRQEGDFRNLNTLYGFLDYSQLSSLDDYLLQNHNRVIAFSRGNSSKLAIVEIKQEHKDRAKSKESILDYLSEEVSEGRMTPSHAKQLIKLFESPDYKRSLKQRAAEIAVHESMKEIWPKYLMDEKGGANVYKRLKIPFTPVTVNEQMEDLTMYHFDPKKVMFQYKDGEIYSPRKKVSGKGMVYIGDGETMTSKEGFKKFWRGHGLRLGTDIAKTVQYMMDGINTYALKHLHIQVEPGLKILNKKGTKVLYEVNESGNIHLGKDHPNYKEGELNYVDFLATSDEVKIGAEKDGMIIDKDGKYRENGKLIIPGISVGFIKFEEGTTPHGKHPQQVYNFVTNPTIIRHFMENYIPVIQNKIREAIRIASDTKGGKTAAEKISKKLEDIHGVDEIGMIPHLIELAKLGAGLHRQVGILIDDLIQNHLVRPALTLDGYNGSTYNVAMDVTNILEPGDIGISRHKAKHVFDKYMEAHPDVKSIKDITNEEINAWLSENKVYAMVTRFPVANEGGSYMGRVRLIHNRQAVATMHVSDVKNRIEGDNDGDHVEIEFLPTEEMTRDYVEHFNNLEIRDLNLDNFVNDKLKYFLLSRKGRAGLIERLTQGELAIGEIANIASAYGIMNNIFESFESIQYSGVNIIMKNPKDKIFLNIFYKGKQGWTGTVEEFLRLYIQAAVDNAKYGLLGQWDYSMDSVWHNLFIYDNGVPIDVEGKDFKEIIAPLRFHHINANKIRNGMNFQGKFPFKEILERSSDYYSYIINRQGYLWNNMKIVAKLKPKNAMDFKLTPIEAVAIAPIEMLHEMSSVAKYNIMGTDVSPYIVNETIHVNSHLSTMAQLDLRKLELFEEAFIADGIIDQVKKQEERKKGEEYVEEMATEFTKRREEYNAKGPQSIDRNDAIIKWKEEFDAKFNKLSNSAKLAATFSFLEGQANDAYEWGYHIPPVSEKDNQASLLDPSLMKTYFKLYNSEVRNSKNATEGVLRLKKYTPLKRTIEELC